MDPFVYQYACGGVVFVVGLAVVWRRGQLGSGSVAWRRAAYLVIGLLLFAALQAYLQYAPMEELAAVQPLEPPQRPSVRPAGVDLAVMAAYFVAILVIGTVAGRGQKTLQDYFFAGRRFSWWMIACSLVATLVGSYSFVKYSRVAFEFGLSSSQTYLNDWFWMPLLAFGWVPLFYASGVSSVPEYFERRFDRTVRLWATVVLLIYLVSYIGVNLFTMGTALHQLLGWPVFAAAAGIAAVSAVYVTSGGQTSVIVTDLFQGVMLLVCGGLILALGAGQLGDLETFWQHLPRAHREAFPPFNEDPSFSAVGIFWQDSMANSAMFLFVNQGILMRFLAARDAGEARKAALVVPLVLMPIAACVVAGGGWVARACVHAGVLPDDLQAEEAFFVVTKLISRPGLFGLIMAALTAALMSTVDTLITAVAAIFVNDVYRPYIRPHAGERHLLGVSRLTAAGFTVLGVALVPVFMGFGSIYAAHGAMTAAVTPPLVVTLLLSVFWKRYTRAAALSSLVGGMVAIVLSSLWPEQLIGPLAHGVPAGAAGGGLLAGFKQYKFMRALFGLAVSTALGVGVTLLGRSREAGHHVQDVR